MRSTEKIKKLIRKLNLDVYTNSEADQRVLSELLHVQEKSHQTEPTFVSTKIRRKTMFSGKRTWKVAALVAAVIGIGAISVVGVTISRIYYWGKTDDGLHIFMSDDFETVVTTDDDGVTDVEQTTRDLEEMKILSQQGKRELLWVKEAIIGTCRIKKNEYRYQLSDGRTSDMGEGADDMPAYNAEQWKEFGSQLEELRRLQKTGPGEDLGTYEETVEGRAFSFKREKYFLGDGTEAIWSVGTPKDAQ